MPKNDSLILALLHFAGCTHQHMHMLFGHEKYNPQDVYNHFMGNTPIDISWMQIKKQESISEALKKVDISKIENILQDKNIEIITVEDESYPERLKQVPKHPYLLYVRGTLKSLPIQLAIVGSRKYTPYGKKSIEFLSKHFTNYPIGIISGGAYGIDAIGHKSALDNGLYTLSVFGCGVDQFYPENNSALFHSILENGGALISPFPLMAEPLPYHFPIRNVIVAGLSDGIIIAEGAKKSGTLITARLALEQNKDVFVVPGDIFRETSQGSNELIVKGEAQPVISARDILEEYGITNTPDREDAPKKQITFTSEDSKRIYEQVQLGNNTPDSIIQNILVDHASVVSELTLLEIDGHIRLMSDGSYECI